MLNDKSNRYMMSLATAMRLNSDLMIACLSHQDMKDVTLFNDTVMNLGAALIRQAREQSDRPVKKIVIEYDVAEDDSFTSSITIHRKGDVALLGVIDGTTDR